jgi:lactaldehyde dehydrogenase/glycolaldehyde dehydrogenase
MHSTASTIPQHQMLIDGEFVAAKKTIAVVNPTTEEVISEVPSGTLEDVNAAVLAAEKAQKSWSRLPAIQRA